MSAGATSTATTATTATTTAGSATGAGSVAGAMGGAGGGPGAAPPPWPLPNGNHQTAPEIRGGLTRRVPGTHLASNLRGGPPPAPVPAPAGHAGRDPEAERAQLDDFMAGLARGSVAPSEQIDSNPLPTGDA